MSNKPDTRAARQILCNELGLTLETVREIVGEKVDQHLRRLSPDLETLIRRTTEATVKAMFQKEARAAGRYSSSSMEGVVKDEAERQLAPVIKRMIARVLAEEDLT